MKRFIAMLLAVAVVFTSADYTALAEEIAEAASTSDGFVYESNEEGLTITAYTGEDVFADVPATINDESVTTIAAGTFAERNDVVGIEIPEGVTTIEKGAFSGLSEIEYISLPSSITEIGEGVLPEELEECIYLVVKNTAVYEHVSDQNLSYIYRGENDAVSEAGTTGNVSYRYNYQTKKMYVYGEGAMANYSGNNAPWNSYKTSIESLEIMRGVTHLGSYAFYGCSGVKGDLIIPDSVTTIGNYGFYGCTGISGLHLSEKLTVISSNAFDNCTGLTGTLTIPDNITTINSYAFRNCSKVEKLVLGSGLTNIKGNRYDYQPFYGMSGVKTVTFKGDTPPATEYVDIFYSMSQLENVYVPASSYSAYVSKFNIYANNGRVLIETDQEMIIEDGVLLQYTGEAEEVVIPDEVMEIGEAAFKNNTTMESIILGANVKKIGKDAFCNASSLKYITWNEALEEIGATAFYACKKLRGNLIFSETVTSIGSYAFYSCDAITSVTIEGSEEGLVIPEYAFAECGKLESIVLGNITTIGQYAFYNSDLLETVDLGAVSKIEQYAFTNSESLKSIDLKQVKTLGNYAFANCTGLKSVNFQKVETIGSYAFQSCTELSGELVLPDTLTNLGDYAFYSCTGLNGLTLPESLTLLPNYVFSGCSGLTGEIVVPNTVKTINKGAFRNCTNVESLVLGSGLTNLYGNSYDYQPFYGMSGVIKVTFKGETPPASQYADIFYSMNNLEKVYVPATSYSAYVTKYSGYINNGRILMESDSDIVVVDGVLLQYTGEDTELVIPEEVTEIGASALKNNKTIEKVILGTNVQKISAEAFQNCTKLKSVTFNENLKTIGTNAFYGCTMLEGSLVIPSSVTSVGNYAFYNCNAITDVTIGASDELTIGTYAFAESDNMVSASLGNTTTIGNYAFYNNQKLADVDLGSVTSIGAYAFYYCRGLTSVDLKNVKTLGGCGFAACSNLSSVNFQNIETIGNDAFQSCSALRGELVLPDTLTTLGNYAFYNCPGLTGFILPESLSSLPAYVFASCSGFTGEIVIPDTIKTIGNGAFKNCTKVESLVLGSGLTKFYGNSYDIQPFYGMSGVKTVTFKGETPPTSEYADIFYSMNNLEKVYVPAASYSTYVNKYKSYINNAQILMDASSDMVIKDGVLLQYTGESTEVVIPDEVTEIGQSVFQNSTVVESVVLGANVKKIATSAFQNCKTLKSVTFNETLEIIESYAFYGCTALEGSIVIPSSVTSIGTYAFYNCNALTGVTIEGSEELTIGTYAFAEIDNMVSASFGNTTTIGNYAFYNNQKLADIDLGNVTSIGAYAFYNCDGITSIDLKNVKTLSNDVFTSCGNLAVVDWQNVETIGNGAFNGCTALSGELILPDTVTSIGSHAFYYCPHITGVTLSKNLTVIGANAFQNCTGLTGEIVIPDKVTSIGRHTFQYCSKVESIVFGSGLTNIYGNSYDYMPFYGMSGVKKVTFKRVTPPTMEYADLFYSMNNLETVYVPTAGFAAYAETYRTNLNNARILAWDSEDDFIIVDNILYAYQGEDAEVTIPDGVERIHDCAFINNTAIKKVIMNDGLLSVGKSAFERCTALEEIVFSDSIESIERSAFRYCESLEKEVVLPQKLLLLDNYVFESCKKLTSVILPSDKEKITMGTNVFANDTALTNVELGKASSVGEYAFQNCSQLKKVDLGTVETIGNYAFYNCSALSEIDYKNVVSIGSYAFCNCDGLSSIDLKNVETLSNDVFTNCNNLAKVDFQTIKTIGNGAFNSCTSLSGKLILPDTVTSVGSHAFYNCTSLTGVTLSKNLTAIAVNTFQGCTSFTGEIVIPDKVTSIGRQAFQSCSKVESIVLGSGLTNINGNSYDYLPFYGMSGVKDVTFRKVTPPTTEYVDIFYSMNGLENVYVPSDGRVAYANKFRQYLNNAQMKVWDNEDDFIIEDEVLFSYQGTAAEVVIPDGIEEIGASAFQNNTTIEKLILGKDVEIIGDSAFQNCVNLKEIVWNEKVETIGISAFNTCTNLEGNLEIPTSVLQIGSSAFRNCDKLTGVKIRGNEEDGTTIGQYAFYDSALLANVELGNITSMDTYAFAYCSKLVNVDLGNLAVIPTYAFYYCSELPTMDFRNVKTIGSYAFSYCTSLATVDLREVRTINNNAFDHAGITGELVIPDTVTTMGSSVFYYCQKITSVKLSESLVDIPQYAFYNCTELSGEVVVPDSVKGIGISSFAYCSKIESLVLGSSVSSIYGNSNMSSHPFYGMSGVKTVAFKGLKTPASYHVDVFYSMNKLETIYVPAASYDAYVKMLDACKNNAVFSTNWLDCEVGNLQASNIYSTTVKLTWSPHQNDNVTSYVILRDGKEVGTAKNTYFVDYELIPNQEYIYSVYGVTDTEEVTKAAELKVTPEKMQFTELKTNHSGNKVALTDGKIYITAKKNANYTDLEGNLVSGRLYYIDKEGRRVFIDKSNLTVKSSSLQFVVNWDITDIEEGNYEVIFVYEDIDGTISEISGNVEVYKTVPEKIANVVAVGDYNSIVISWSKSSEVDSEIYHIYRKSEVDENFTLLKTIKNRNTLSYTDSSVRSERKYAYYVITENSFGITSEKSDEAVAMKAVDTEAPTVTKITPATSSIISERVTVTVEADDNLKATSVKLYYSVNETDWVEIGEDTSAPFSFLWNVGKLEDGEVTVKAVACDAQGNESEGRKVTYKIDNSGPEAVTGLTASTILSSKLTLKWDDSKAADAAGFILEQKEGDGKFKVVASKITTLGYNIENLKPETTYTFRVAAVDTQGNQGAYSEEYTVTTAKDTMAPVITSLSPAASRKNSTIAFSATAGDDCGVQKISIQISQDRKEWTTVSYGTYSTAKKVATYSFSVPIDEFEDGSLYVRAVAVDFSGNESDTSDAAAFVEYLIDKSAPNSPRDLMACGGDGYIYLSWLQGEEEDLGKYSVYRSTSKDDGFTLLASGLSTVNYYDTAAERGTTYYYKIAVMDTIGNISEFSSVVSAKVAEDVTPPEIVSISPADSSQIGPGYHTVEALVKDNNALQSVTFEYKLKENDNYQTLKIINNIGYYYKTVSADIPLEGLVNGDVVYVRVFCRDISGYTSEYSYEYKYIMDDVAPALTDLAYTLTGNEVKLTWKDYMASDLSGFKIYRMHANGAEQFLGTRLQSWNRSYTFYDYLPKTEDGDYSYRIDTFDKVGNKNVFFTDIIHYEYVEPERVNQAPVAKITGMEVMEVGVEEYFDASASTDNDGNIASYHWDFGDGTSSDKMTVVKKFKKAGTYEVKLTVTDNEGLSSEVWYNVNVTERTSMGEIKVKVVDENGRPVSFAPVYYNLGTAKQKVIYADESGTATYNMENGEYQIGCYKQGYLPATKNVKVLPNATRTVTLVIIEEEIVTGEFEVTRMTFSEIIDAGIDVYDPANQNVYKVRVTLKYGDSEVPIEYVRNDSGILDYSVGDDSGGKKGGSGSDHGGGGGGRSHGIAGIGYVPNDEGIEIVAVLQTDMAASTVKEFFDVKLHIINNAESKFLLKNNSVDLEVPDGMTLMSGLIGEWSDSTHVEFDKLYGQETETTAWVLRGDEVGEYDLTAQYQGTLDMFEEAVSATFETDEPIKVYGMSDFVFDIEVNSEIRYNAFYFNIGLKNNGSIDYYNPTLDFDGIVSNITSSTYAKANGEETDITDKEEEDFDISSRLLNVRHVSADGTEEYVTYTTDKNGQIDTNLDTLSPGEVIYYEYVAYNMINYDGIAYFNDAVYEELEGVGGGVEIRTVDMDLYSLEDSMLKVDKLKKNGSDSSKGAAYLLDNTKYIAVANSDLGSKIQTTLYDALKLVLTLDTKVLTDEDKREVIDQMLVSIVTDESLYSNIDDMVNAQYTSGVKSVLEFLKQTCDDIKFDDTTDRTKWIAVINDALKNKDKMDRMVDATKNQSGEELEQSFIEILGFDALTGLSVAGYTGFKLALSNALKMNPDSALLKGISGAGKYGGMFIDYALLTPLEAYESSQKTTALYALIQMQACKEEAVLLMNTVSEYFAVDGSDVLEGLVSTVVLGPMKPLYSAIATDYKKLIRQEAEDMKELIIENAYKESHEFVKKLSQYTVEKVGKQVIEKAIGKMLGKANVWYVLIGAAFEIGAYHWKLEDKSNAAESFAIASYIALAVSSGYDIFKNAYGNESSYAILEDSDLCEDVLADGESLDDDRAAIFTLYQVKYLTKIRLIGEEAVYKYIAKDNGTPTKSDKDHDEDVRKELNKIFDTSGKTIEEIFDLVYGRILKHRDSIFNIEKKETLVKPEAPVVTIDYENLCTVESFDDTYEYCYADGEWRSCEDESIPVTPKTHTTVLRVRKASAKQNMAGEITTVTIYAKKELPKFITVKYTNGTYYITKLNPKYTYEIVTLEDAKAEPDWSKAQKIGGRASSDELLRTAKSEYVAIRALQNDELYEMTSEPSVYRVGAEEKLTVIVEGNGSVKQTTSDGKYFVGDTVTLTATPKDKAAFAGWYLDNELVSKDTTYLLEMYPFAEIRARFDDGTTINPDSVTISSLNAAYSLRTLRAPAMTMEIGEQSKLHAEVSPENATDKTITWTSSDDSVLSVSGTGVITGKKAGTVTITATTSNGYSSTYGVEVLEPKVTELAIVRMPSVRTYFEGEKLDLDGLKVRAEYDTGNVEIVEDYEVTGYNAYAAGKQTLTISYKEATITFTVNVKHDAVWKDISESTCSTAGVKQKVCKSCEAVVDTKELPLAEHAYEWIYGDEVKELKCTVCGEVKESHEIEAHEHQYETETVQATCVENGTITYTCTVCGHSYEEVINAAGHTCEAKVVEATCNKKGYTLLVCTVCGEKEFTDITSKTEHILEERTVAASCAGQGYDEIYCVNCDYSEKSNYTDQLEHSYYTEYTDATCEYGSGTKYVCEKCDYFYVDEESEAIGHKYKKVVVTPTCENSGYTEYTCEYCEHTYRDDVKSALGHRFGSWMVKTPSTEDIKGVMYRVCSVCNEEETKRIDKANHPHVASEWEVISKATCGVYGVEATKCLICGEMVESRTIEALEHEYTKVVTESDCTNKGCTTHTCKNCGDVYTTDYSEAKGHEPGAEVVVEATCKNAGSKTITCEVCKATLAKEILPVKDHEIDGWTADVTATTERDGKSLKKCKNCHWVMDETTVARITEPELEQSQYFYDGTEKLPTVVVKDMEGKVLRLEKDYVVSRPEKSEKPGTYEVKVELKGNYEGTFTLAYFIDLAMPEEMSAELTTYNAVKVSWSKVYGANGYNVYYKKAADKSYIKQAAVEGTNYQFNSLAAGTEFTFKIVPYYLENDIKVESVFEKTESVTTLKKMATPKVGKDSAGKVKMSWTKIAGASGYQISWSTSKTATANTSTTTSNYKLITPTYHKTIYYKVRAYQTVDGSKVYGPWSSVASYKLSYVAAASGVKAELYGHNDVKVSWSKAPGANQYTVYYKKASASKYTKLKSTTSTSYKKANLSDGVQYTFKVVPQYVSGGKVKVSGTYKTVSIYTLKKLGTPTVAKYNSSNVKVSWKNINGESGYQISKSTTKTGTKIVATYATTTGKTKTIAATKGKTYYYKVRAYKTVGNTKIYGPWSSVKAYKLK